MIKSDNLTKFEFRDKVLKHLKIKPLKTSNDYECSANIRRLSSLNRICKYLNINNNIIKNSHYFADYLWEKDNPLNLITFRHYFKKE